MSAFLALLKQLTHFLNVSPLRCFTWTSNVLYSLWGPLPRRSWSRMAFSDHYRKKRIDREVFRTSVQHYRLRSSLRPDTICSLAPTSTRWISLSAPTGRWSCHNEGWSTSWTSRRKVSPSLSLRMSCLFSAWYLRQDHFSPSWENTHFGEARQQ